jgi:hypothetical protein
MQNRKTEIFFSMDDTQEESREYFSLSEERLIARRQRRN